jgi:hypothetical protein
MLAPTLCSHLCTLLDRVLLDDRYRGLDGLVRKKLRRVVAVHNNVRPAGNEMAPSAGAELYFGRHTLLEFMLLKSPTFAKEAIVTDDVPLCGHPAALCSCLIVRRTVRSRKGSTTESRTCRLCRSDLNLSTGVRRVGLHFAACGFVCGCLARVAGAHDFPFGPSAAL